MINYRKSAQSKSAIIHDIKNNKVRSGFNRIFGFKDAI